MLNVIVQAVERAEAAMVRAALAEQAKIELTLALAEAAEARVKDVDTHVAVPATTASRDSSADGDRHSDTAGEGAGDDAAPTAVDGWDQWNDGDVAGDFGLQDDTAGADAAVDRRSSKAGGRGISTAGAGRAAVTLQEVPAGSTVVQASEMEALLTRAEEAELAAAVQTRRAAAAEAEVDGLQKRLEQAEKQVKELGWQIQMVMEPVTIGGGQKGRGAPGGAGAAGGSGWFADMLGCGANFVRK